MPALSPTAVEDGLSSVLARLSADGEVAHEEDIGEQAVLDHLKADGSRSAAPVYDYKMIDSDYLLAPVVSAWLLHDARGTRAGTRRSSPPAAGATAADVAARAVRHCFAICGWCSRSAAAFAAAPR